jgi:hypothetical protein
LNKRIIEFIGKNTGDGECFCWDVDKENFIKVKGKEPGIFDYEPYGMVELMDFHKAIKNNDINYVKENGFLRLYPDDVFEEWDENNINKKSKIKVKIEIEVLDE